MNNGQAQLMIDRLGAKHIINTLQMYVTERRKIRIDDVLQHRLSSIQLVIESPCDINNAFAILRTCECFGIQTLHVIKPGGEAASIRRLTRGAMYWVDIIQHDSVTEFLQSIDRSQCLLAGGILQSTQTLSNVPIDRPLYLLLGNEQKGLSDFTQQACDMTYRIPMCGMSDSLNLSASAAISLYETAQRKRALLNTSGDLNSATKQTLQARYYLNSVTHRLIQALLPMS